MQWYASRCHYFTSQAVHVAVERNSDFHGSKQYQSKITRYGMYLIPVSVHLVCFQLSSYLMMLEITELVSNLAVRACEADE